MFGNHLRILNARIVQSVESVWTVLKYVVQTYIHLPFISKASLNPQT